MAALPHFHYEKNYWSEEIYVIGVDEVGRGCLAGPVYVGGVCFPLLSATRMRSILKLGINDSKKLSAKRREALCAPIREHALGYAVSGRSVQEIDEIGIVPAIERAVHAVVQEIRPVLPANAQVVLLTDSLPIRSFKLFPQEIIPQGDANCVSIAAASVIAKVARDNEMTRLHDAFPHYKWNINKGYGTKVHREAIKAHGPCHLHRSLYIRNVLSE